MPKMKTHSSSKKRFRKTGNGLLKRSKGYRRHHAWAKSKKQLRKLASVSYLNDMDAKRIIKLLPY